MADNPFAGLGDSAEAAQGPAPITDEQRLVLTNLFDTQPKRRAAYLKQLGYEMNPKDTNTVRPLGSPPDAPYSVEIDPGGWFNISQYYKNGLSKGLNELGLDLGDIGSDVQKASLITAGATGGAAAGAAGGPLAILGAILGGAAGSYAAEEAKKQVGDIYLQKDVPNDKKTQVVGAVIDGLVPEIMKQGGIAAKGFVANRLQSQKEAITNAIKGGGGVANEELINYAAKNPELFTKEAVAGANKGYIDTFKKFFGLEPDQFSKEVTDFNKIPTDSVFGAQIKPLKDAAGGELAKLSANPNASVNGAQIASQLQGTIKDLSAKPFRTEIEDNALKTAKSLLDDVVNGARQITGNNKLTSQELNTVSFNYGQARDLLKRVQEKAFDIGQFGTKSENPIIASIAGNARRGLDQVAAANGSSLPQINAAQSEILNTFRQAQTQLSPEKLFQAYTGNSKVASQEIRDFVTNQIDAKYGTNWGDQFTESAAKKYFEGVFKNTAAKGSREIQAQMAQEAAKQAAIGAGTGATIGGTIGALGGGMGAVPGAAIGSALGGAAGYVRGRSLGAALANPEIGIQTIANINQQLAQPAATGLTEQAIGAALAPQVSRPVAPAVAPLLPDLNKPEDNPFAGLGE